MLRACGKWSPSGDTGEMAGHRTDPTVSRPERRAGCACAAHKEAGTGGCVGIVRRDGSSEGQTLSVGIPETDGRHPPAQPLQRDWSRGQKPLNGALKGATYIPFHEATSSTPSECL